MSWISSGFSFSCLVRTMKVHKFEFAAINGKQIRNRDASLAPEIRPDPIAEICTLDSVPVPRKSDQTKGDEHEKVRDGLTVRTLLQVHDLCKDLITCSRAPVTLITCGEGTVQSCGRRHSEHIAERPTRLHDRSRPGKCRGTNQYRTRVTGSPEVGLFGVNLT